MMALDANWKITAKGYLFQSLKGLKG